MNLNKSRLGLIHLQGGKWIQSQSDRVQPSCAHLGTFYQVLRSKTRQLEELMQAIYNSLQKKKSCFYGKLTAEL